MADTKADVEVPPIYGQCLACRSIEVRLNNVVKYVDLAYMGESEAYPLGYGCELCS